MLGLRHVQRTMVTALGKARFSRLTLRGKKLVFEWQKQTDGPDAKPPRWMNKTEIEEAEETRQRIREKEDFRRELFDLNPKPAPPKVERDYVFGTDIPEPRPFERVTVPELYNHSDYEGRNWLMRLKIEYLTEFSSRPVIYDSNLTGPLAELRELVLETAARLNVEEPSHIPDAERAKMFQSAQGVSALQRLYQAIQRTSHKNLPDLVLQLANDLQYSSDDFTEFRLYDAVLASLHKASHLITTVELAKLHFALTFSFPKKGPQALRALIRKEVLKLDFAALSLSEVLHLFTAFKTDVNNTEVQRRCTQFLLSKHAALQPLLAKNPSLALDILYTFANSKPVKRNLRRLRVVDLNQREDLQFDDQMEHLYMPHVLKALPRLGEAELVRLLSIIRVMQLHDYDEVFEHTTRNILRNFDVMDSKILGFLVESAAKSNGRGFGSQAFWKELAAKFAASLQSSPHRLSQPTILRLCHGISHNKVVSPDEFAAKFGAVFTRAIEDPATGQGDIAMGLWTALALDLQAKGKDAAKPIAAAAMRALVKKNEWVQVFHAQAVKYFIWYFGKRFPDWQMGLLENLVISADRQISTSRFRPRLQTKEFADFAVVVKKQLQLDILSFVDFENLFLIDFAQQDYRFAIFVRDEAACVYSGPTEERVSTPLFDLKREILAQNGWTVLTIDDEEFKGRGEGRVDWLREQIQASFKQCLDRKPELARQKIEEIETREMDEMFHDMREDPEFESHKFLIRDWIEMGINPLEVKQAPQVAAPVEEPKPQLAAAKDTNAKAKQGAKAEKPPKEKPAKK